MLLVGGVVTSRLVAPGLLAVRGRRLLRLGLVLGALLLMGGALLEVAVTLKGALGRVDPDLFRRYLTSTRHGELARLRLLLAPAAALVALALDWRGLAGRGAGAARAVGGLVLLALCGELLYTFSLLSHAAAMGGRAPLLADLVHLLAAALWAGPVLYLAAVGGFSAAAPEARRAARRVSRIGVVAVVALALTGTFTGLTHAADPLGFARSAYGLALWVKLGLFALVLVAATRNRLVHLPRFLQGGEGRGLLRSMRVEALLLLLLFAVTGALTTAALPHAHGATTDAFVNLQRVLELLAR